MLVRPKGTTPHRALGATYMALLAVSALSDFWLRGIANGGFSFLHLLSIGVLLALPFAWLMARRGNIPAHRFTMIGVYVGGIWVAGLFTLLPAVCCTARCSPEVVVGAANSASRAFQGARSWPFRPCCETLWRSRWSARRCSSFPIPIW